MKIKVEDLKIKQVDYRKLKPLQGRLKDLSDENYKKLKKSLEKKGFFVPIFVWQKSEDEILILDGHGRESLFRNERARFVDSKGNETFDVPCLFVDAKDIEDAKEKLLVISSQYQKTSSGGLSEYLQEGKISNDIFDYIDMGLEMDDLDIGDIGEKKSSNTNKIPKAIQLKPMREYIVVMCEDDEGVEFDALKTALDLGSVRRGGYKVGSAFDAVGTQRVIKAKDLLEKLRALKDK